MTAVPSSDTVEPTSWIDTDTIDTTNTHNNVQPWQQGDDISLYDSGISELLAQVHNTQQQLNNKRTQLYTSIQSYRLDQSSVKTDTEQLIKKMEKTYASLEKLG